MELWQAILLGIVQGLGEFLPISSSAHLILVPWFFNFPDPGLSFDAVLHLGTLAALLAVFWRDWWEILRAGFSRAQTTVDRAQKNNPDPTYKLKAKSHKLFYWILVATIPGVLAGYFLESQAETIFRAPLVLAITLSVMGIVLWISQRFAKPMVQPLVQPVGSFLVEPVEPVEPGLTFGKTLWVGLAQALAIIPGVSRSGITMSTGMFLGLSKIAAARFSFLLSTPIVLGAGIFSLKGLLVPNTLVQPVGSFLVEPVYLIIAFATAAVSGFFAIKFLLKWLEKASFTPFVVYRLLLAAVILLLLSLGWK